MIAVGLQWVANAHGLTERFLGARSVVAASPVLSVAPETHAPSGAITQTLAEGVIPGEFGPTPSPAARGLLPSPLPLGNPTDLVHVTDKSVE